MRSLSKEKMSNRIVGLVVVAMLVVAVMMTGCASNSGSGSSSNNSSASSEQQAPEMLTTTMTVKNLDGTVLFDNDVEVDSDSTVMNVLEESGANYQSEDGAYGAYVVSLEDVMASSNSGWTYTINGEQPANSADNQPVSDGDVIVWELVEF